MAVLYGVNPPSYPPVVYTAIMPCPDCAELRAAMEATDAH